MASSSAESESQLKYLQALLAHKTFFSKYLSEGQVIDIIWDFKSSYHRISESNPFTCNIANLTARSRIILLKILAAINLSRDSRVIYIKFLLGQVIFDVKLQPGEVQRGNIYLQSIGNYNEIAAEMRAIYKDVAPIDIVEAIRSARVNGRPITMSSIPNAKGQPDTEFLNQFMFLWEIEIARHLQPVHVTNNSLESSFNNLPVSIGISSIHYFIEKWKFGFVKYLNKKSRYHFFAGQPSQREIALKRVLHKRQFESFNDILQELANEFGV